ncbi:FixH family protein [Rhodocyclus tenuis]|uniref:Nitrogen fixation protein FixH n=1 Tax=Rhodocyclus tenuis TaxID=1066 RepID=A0A840G7P0_RHOTE|nr:FixH family protein [Rhodocyclus tenuis]MBB4246728.1 hypothetical protein [Rhodocyclus tenuis]
MNTACRAALARPWYRERWPWILMAGPFIVIVAGFITAWLAIRSSDGLVDDDYYKQGLAVSQRVERDQHAHDLGIRAEIVLQSAQSASEPELRVFLRGLPAYTPPNELALRIVHPTRSGLDQRVVLRAIGSGLYAARLSAPLTGRWRFALEDSTNDWRLVGEWNVSAESSLSLPAPPRSATPPITYKGK